MKKRISKNIFHFSNLIIELKKEKQKKIFFWIYFDLKPISKNKNQNFSVHFLIWNQKLNLKKICRFLTWVLKLKKKKWKNFKIRFVFKSKKIILSIHGFSKFCNSFLDLKWKNEFKKIFFIFQFWFELKSETTKKTIRHRLSSVHRKYHLIFNLKLKLKIGKM